MRIAIYGRVSTNVLGTMLCAREAVRLMSTRHGGQGGGIVNFSSVAARTGGFPGIAPYAATKGTIESFTNGLASEVAQEGIRVNAVAPGVVETDILTPAMIEAARSTIPLGRARQPNEVADVVAWLLSQASSYVTGSVVTVSGGRWMARGPTRATRRGGADGGQDGFLVAGEPNVQFSLPRWRSLVEAGTSSVETVYNGGADGPVGGCR